MVDTLAALVSNTESTPIVEGEKFGANVAPYPCFSAEFFKDLSKDPFEDLSKDLFEDLDILARQKICGRTVLMEMAIGHHQEGRHCFFHRVRAALRASNSLHRYRRTPAYERSNHPHPPLPWRFFFGKNKDSREFKTNRECLSIPIRFVLKSHRLVVFYRS
jgi:hypothetical protein